MIEPRVSCSCLKAARRAPGRAWPAPTTKIVAAAAFDRSCASARCITGGPSITMRSKTSEPTDNKEWRRAPPNRSAALGGNGPDAMKARFGKLGFLHALGRRARAGKAVTKSNRIVSSRALYVAKDCADRRRSKEPCGRPWRNVSRWLWPWTTYPLTGRAGDCQCFGQTALGRKK